MNKQILILTSEDWEGFFIDGKLIEEGHQLGEGRSRVFLLEMAEKYGFKSTDVVEKYINSDLDQEYLWENGSFPTNLSELKGNYEK